MNTDPDVCISCGGYAEQRQTVLGLLQGHGLKTGAEILE